MSSQVSVCGELIETGGDSKKESIGDMGLAFQS